MEQVFVNGGTTTTTAYIGSIEEVSTTGSNTTTIANYYFDGEKIALSKNGTFSFLGNDPVGTPLESLDSVGNLQADQLFVPYGERRNNTNGMPDGYKWAEQNDDSTGLYYDAARYYDPVAAQYVSADTILPGKGYDFLGLSHYAYVGGNPISRSDPSGHDYCFGICDAFSNAVNDFGNTIMSYADPAWGPGGDSIQNLQNSCGTCAQAGYGWHPSETNQYWNETVNNGLQAATGFTLADALVITGAALVEPATVVGIALWQIAEPSYYAVSAFLFKVATSPKTQTTVMGTQAGASIVSSVANGNNSNVANPNSSLPPGFDTCYTNCASTQTVVNGPQTLYNYGGMLTGGSKAGQPSSTDWWTDKLYGSQQEVRSNLAIRDDWNNPLNELRVCNIPEGCALLGNEGYASSQGEGYPGGGYQIYMQDVPPEWIETEVFP